MPVEKKQRSEDLRAHRRKVALYQDLRHNARANVSLFGIIFCGLGKLDKDCEFS